MCSSSRHFSSSGCGIERTTVHRRPSSLDPAVNCQEEAVTNVLGTILNGVTPNYAGEAALLGPVSIIPECSCMELCHY
jgi:hypothetical protein